MRVLNKAGVILFATWQAVGFAAPQSCTGASYKKMKPPQYPPEAVRDRVEGKTKLRVVVDVDGMPKDISVETSSGNGALDAAAISSVADWRFEPKRCDGKAVSAEVFLPVNFALTHDDSPATQLFLNSMKDDEPMEFSEIKEELSSLQKRSDLDHRTHQNMQLFVEKKLLPKMWLAVEAPDAKSSAVIRTRQVIRDGSPVQLFAYLCDGSKEWCAKFIDDQIAFMRRNPPPPPPTLGK